MSRVFSLSIYLDNKHSKIALRLALSLLVQKLELIFLFLVLIFALTLRPCTHMQIKHTWFEQIRPELLHTDREFEQLKEVLFAHVNAALRAHFPKEKSGLAARRRRDQPGQGWRSFWCFIFCVPYTNIWDMLLVPNESPCSVLYLEGFFLDWFRFDDTRAIIVHVSLIINHAVCCSKVSMNGLCASVIVKGSDR